MKSFAVSIRIKAPVERIWALLTDAKIYPAWNSTVDRIDGRIAADETITVHSKAASGRAFPVKVGEFEHNRRMVWSGGLPLGLFTGQRVFALQEAPGGAVEFSMREQFGGLLAGLIARSIPDLQPAFDAFAADLKRQAETSGSGPPSKPKQTTPDQSGGRPA